MGRHGKRRRPGFYIGNFYLNSSAQYATTVISAIVFAGFVFSGFLLFRYTDSDDLIARGKRLMAEGKMAWASKAFQTLVNRHPDSYEGHLLLGQVYLELGDRQKAEIEFRSAAALRQENDTGHEAEIAMSKYDIAKRDFFSAEAKLMKVYRQAPQDITIRQALYELYHSWGNDVFEMEHDYPLAIGKYERALRYVQEYHQEDKLKEKLIEVITLYADKANADKNFEESIRMLKKSLMYRYLPDTLIQIAESYERSEQIDEAIVWYRKAFDADPSIISIKLSNMLIKKGRQLLEQKQPEAAERYFNEARQVSATTSVPMDVMFPVTVSGVKITADIDEETSEFMPQVRLNIQNGGQRPLNFLQTKVTFFSGEEIIGEVVQPIVTPDKPLMGKGIQDSDKSVTLQPEEKLNLNLLNGVRRVRVKISICYTEDKAATWKEMAIQEVDLTPSSETKNTHQA